MTAPDERETARQEADDALARAKLVAARGAKIGERWRKSQVDNNFRLMLRQLGHRAVDNA